MLLFLAIQMQTPTFPAYVKQAYQANDFVVSLVISLFSLAAVVARALTGEALRTKNSKVIAMLALCTVGIFSAGYYWAGHIALFLFLRVLVGIGFGMGSTAFPTVVSNVIPVRRIGEGMGYFGLSTSLAMALGPLIGLGILQSFGIGPMLLTLVLLVAAIFPLAHMIRSYSLRMAPAPKAAPVKGFARFFDKKLLLPVSLNFCLSITYGGILSFLALYGKETHIANVGWFFLANALAMILIRPFSGKLYDRKGHIAVLPPGAIFVGVSLLLLSVTTSESLLLISAFFYGLGYGMIQPSIQAWMVKVVAPEQRGMGKRPVLQFHRPRHRRRLHAARRACDSFQLLGHVPLVSRLHAVVPRRLRLVAACGSQREKGTAGRRTYRSIRKRQSSFEPHRRTGLPLCFFSVVVTFAAGASSLLPQCPCGIALLRTKSPAQTRTPLHALVRGRLRFRLRRARGRRWSQCLRLFAWCRHGIR
ncbi:hypothetical protein D478_00750 [Brevibacillus agri BAB-2500]|nr:hypothetical protein D478_00750 [Brevibacillus agri BAB-2500]